MAESVSAAHVPEGAVIFLPLPEPAADQTIDFTLVAASKCPVTFGLVAGYKLPHQPRRSRFQVGEATALIRGSLLSVRRHFSIVKICDGIGFKGKTVKNFSTYCTWGEKKKKLCALEN
jgi:hypothetical protein